MAETTSIQGGAAAAQHEFEAGGHVCLAGAGVTNNWRLIDPLKRNHQVTVVERPRMLFANSILATASVLVLDCGEDPQWALKAVNGLRRVYPDVSILLVNGGLTPTQIAEAFRGGVRDYFSHQSNAELVAERVENLCRQARGGCADRLGQPSTAARLGSVQEPLR